MIQRFNSLVFWGSGVIISVCLLQLLISCSNTIISNKTPTNKKIDVFSDHKDNFDYMKDAVNEEKQPFLQNNTKKDSENNTKDDDDDDYDII